MKEDIFAQAIVNVAPKIAKKCPAELLTEMAEWVVDDINALASRLLKLNDVTDIDKLVGKIDGRLQMARQYFFDFWNLDIERDGRKVMELPLSASDIFRYRRKAYVNSDCAHKALSVRISGASVIYDWEPDEAPPSSAIGTDASVADIYLQHSTGTFLPPDPGSSHDSGCCTNFTRKRTYNWRISGF